MLPSQVAAIVGSELRGRMTVAGQDKNPADQSALFLHNVGFRQGLQKGDYVAIPRGVGQTMCLKDYAKLGLICQPCRAK